jgi:hypothetical protein
LAEELATSWLFLENGEVVARSFCRGCAPVGPVADLACVSCGDGPLLAGALTEQSARAAVNTWLLGQGWQVAGAPRCPRCTPPPSPPVTDGQPESGGWRLW